MLHYRFHSPINTEVLEERVLLVNNTDITLDQLNQPGALAYLSSTGISLGQKQVVAIIDTGMVLSLFPDRIYVNPGEIAGDGIDNDNNGYVDDITGWNFYNNTNNVNDTQGHGTKVADTVAIVDNNVQFLPIKISTNGTTTVANILKAITYIEMMKSRGVPIVVANMSFSGNTYDSRIANQIASSSIFYVASAGNYNENIDGTTLTEYPTSYPEVIGVASNNPGKLTKAKYSSYGIDVDFTVSGTVWVRGRLGVYSNFSGTSASAPILSGCLSLLSRVTDSRADILNALQSTATSVSYVRYGLPDLNQAVRFVYEHSAPNTLFSLEELRCENNFFSASSFCLETSALPTGSMTVSMTQTAMLSTMLDPSLPIQLARQPVQEQTVEGTLGDKRSIREDQLSTVLPLFLLPRYALTGTGKPTGTTSVVW